MTPPAWRSYGAAVLATGLALGLNLWLVPLIEANVFPLFLAAVTVATWHGGLGPGLASTVLGTLAVALFFLPPAMSLAVTTPAAVARLALFVLSALLMTALATRLHRARESAETGRRAAQDRAAAAAAGEARLRETIELAPDGILVADRDGRIVQANSQVTRMFGYEHDELVGRPVEVLVPARVRAAHAGHRHEYQASPRARPMGVGLDLAGVRKDGTEVPVEISLSPIGVGPDQRIVSVIRDTTERKRAEAAIRTLNDALQLRVAELRALNQELEAFSYSVSHDLRAPLRAIDGFSQALLEDCADRLDDAGRDHLRRVRAAAQRMGELIDDLLGLSRVTRREMRSERVDLTGLAASIVAGLRRNEPGRQVETVIAEGLRAEGDPHLLRLALENLLGNAWKFTARRPAARIELGLRRVDGPPAFFVADNGAGFDMAHAGKLFGAFQRLHAMDEFPGTGIGLATVQRIVHRHGGRIWCEAVPGQGATFYFTLLGGGDGDRREDHPAGGRQP
jgi:PAS domain S-box-containing protein